ncbi:hypothetical protein DV738_g3787, partial [Chaetothyriales sp. CBS 135597]
MVLLETQWVNVQEKTFTKWLNNKVKTRDVAVKSLVSDLSDGIILIHLLEVLSNESLGRYASNPKLRVQKFENVNKSLTYIKNRGIHMTNIGAEDVVDGNRKIILGLIWTLILRFTISDINEEGMTAKEGLLLWCQRKTACYEGVEVRDFSASWNDGLAFCALLDIHRPDLIDFDTLDKSDHRGNMQLAFDIASKEIGIPDLLDVEDVADVPRPDERSLMTYIAYWFHAFSAMERVENAGRRVEKFVSNMQGAWEMESAYERRMRALLQQIRQQRQSWESAVFAGTYADAKQQANDLASYKRKQKRAWVAEKSDLSALLGNIKTKLSTYRLRPYVPPEELRIEVLDQEWAALTTDEQIRSRLINEKIRDIKNALRRSFADKANDFALTLNTLSLAIAGLEGDVQDQLEHAQRLSANLHPLEQYLDGIAVLDEQCQSANIDENDFTTYTYDELVYELGLVKQSVQKKLTFLENQSVARSMTNLTPIQLEEFESVFRHFDRDGTNTLQELEFSAALASLGLVYDELEMHEKYVEVCHSGIDPSASPISRRQRESRGVGFEQFIRFMVSVTEDQNTAEQVFQSFQEVADGKPYVTEMDLRHSLIPDELIEDLLQSMPEHKGDDEGEDPGVPKYDYVSFMQGMINDKEEREKVSKKQPRWSPPSTATHQPGLKVYNSLTRSEVDFIPIEKGRITWYSCGPTVYDDAHLGHARNYVTIDILRRILRDYFGFQIRFVMNITDVDDKIILRARQRHLYDEYKAAHRYIDDEVREHVRQAWLYYIQRNLKRIKLNPAPEPAAFDKIVAAEYADVLDGKALEPNGKAGDAEAKIKMHINTTRATAKALTEDPKMLTPHEFYNLASDPMCLVLDEKSKDTIKGDDHAVFTKLTREYEDRFFKDMRDLNVLDPDELTRVTEYGKEIANFVEKIVNNRFAYKTEDGSVYFDIKAFEEGGYPYARLKPESRGDKELQADGEGALGAKLTGKKADADFALWKASKAGEPSWASEWGPGRPGWHIECSAMASERLGQQMDIHSGGIDLAFPHHDNELAQSEAYWKGNKQWVNYFLHMGHLSIQGSKMSKSLKNFTTIREALHVRKEWTARSLRIVFLLGEWRKGIEITDDLVTEGRSWEDRVDNFFLNVLDALENSKDESSGPTVMAKPLEQAQERVREALLRSFATKDAMYALSELITVYNGADKTNFTRADHEAPATFVTQMVNIFGLNGAATKEDALKSIGWSGLSLSSEAEMYVRPLSGARDLLRQAAIAKTITPEKVQEIIETIPLYATVGTDRPQRPSYARALADFRENVLSATDRNQPESTDLNKQILALCDRVRDVDLWQLEIYLEDRESRPARVRPVTEGLRAARREKEERARQKEAQKLKKAQEDEARLLKGKMPAQEMYKAPYSTEFSEWDADGVPLKLRDGTPVSESKKKTLRKEMLRQQKAHEKYLEAVAKGKLRP